MQNTNTKKQREPGRIISLYLGAARRKALEERARKLGYKTLSEFIAVHLEVAPDVDAMKLPRLRAIQEIESVTLADALARG